MRDFLFNFRLRLTLLTAITAPSVKATAKKRGCREQSSHYAYKAGVFACRESGGALPIGPESLGSRLLVFCIESQLRKLSDQLLGLQTQNHGPEQEI